MTRRGRIHSSHANDIGIRDVDATKRCEGPPVAVSLAISPVARVPARYVSLLSIFVIFCFFNGEYAEHARVHNEAEREAGWTPRPATLQTRHQRTSTTSATTPRRTTTTTTKLSRQVGAGDVPRFRDRPSLCQSRSHRTGGCPRTSHILLTDESPHLIAASVYPVAPSRDSREEAPWFARDVADVPTLIERGAHIGRRE